MSQEIRDFFMEEAEELFDSIHSTLLRNEEIGNMNDEELDSMFRDIHTLKGGAGSVELTEFSAYTHHLENFMDTLRSGTIVLHGKIIDFLIDHVGVMQELLKDEYNDDIDKAYYEQKHQDLLAGIESFLNPKEEAKVEIQEVVEEEEKEDSDSSIREAFGSNAAEILDLFGRLKEDIIAVKSGELLPEDAVSNIFRTIHTLKGSSQFLNLRYFPIYVHEIETLLDKSRNGTIPYSYEFNDFIERTMEIAREFIDDELSAELENENFEKMFTLLKMDIDKFSKESQTDQETPSFELFDEAPKKEQTPAFELFDEAPAKPETPAFELFEESPKQEEKQEVKVVEKPATPQSVNKVVKKEPKEKKNLSLNKAAASTSIRVNLDKIDQLMNRVGDLVITKSMLFQFADSNHNNPIYKEISEKLSDLDRDIRELQESVMSVRMVPMESVYARLPKMVRDLAKKLDKKVKFEHVGDSVEIDKMMVEGLMDPLTHIIRNSLDHGIEKPDVRYANGKSETGHLLISAAQESGNIIISIRDDGAGINVDKVVSKALENEAITEDELARMTDQEKLMLVFHPGLSTAETVTDVSGRGVGMDVVMNNITSLGGFIKVYSKRGKGAEFQIILPLTLAILDGLNVMIGSRKFILPLNSIVESLQPKNHMIKHVGESKKEILMLRSEFIPIIRLHSYFNIQANYTDLEEGMLIIVKTTNSKVAFFVDDFLNQEQIVVKSLEKNYKKINGIGAATIRGDGSIGLILDVSSIVSMK